MMSSRLTPNRKVLRRVLTPLVALCLAGSATRTHAVQVSPQTVETPDGPRSALVARPDRLLGSAPLVLLFHGHGSNARRVLGRDGTASPMKPWLDIVDREGIIVAALDGVPGRDGKTGWNDCRKDATATPRTNDVAFASAVVKSLETSDHVDTSRIYAIGTSNGAMMAMRVAIEMEPPVAGFVAVSGHMAAESQCRSARRPVSALFVTTPQDQAVVPKASGLGSKASGTTRTFDETVTFWRKVDDVPDKPEEDTLLESKGPADSLRVRRIRFPMGRSSTRVEIVRIEAGSSDRPGARQRVKHLYDRLLGRTGESFSSVEESWRFLREAHSTR